MIILLLAIILMRFKQWNLRRQIKWQKFLAGKGVGFRTRILEIAEEGNLLNGYKKFYIKARLRVNGKVVCQAMHTLMKTENSLHVGDRVLIRYKPHNPAHVLVL